MYISPGVRVYDDGREVCDTIGKHRTDEGVEEYRARLRRMWERQHGCIFILLSRIPLS